VQFHVLGTVDNTHASLSQKLTDFVVFDGFVDQQIFIAHSIVYTIGEDLLQHKTRNSANQRQIDGYDTGIIQRTDLTGFFLGKFSVLVDVFDDIQSQQKKVDFDSPLGNFIHDQNRKDNEQTHEHDS